MDSSKDAEVSPAWHLLEHRNVIFIPR